MRTLPGFAFVRGDICDPATVRAVLAGHDQVVHFAAESHVDRSIADGAEFVLTNVLGTHTLVEAARHAGIGTFVHVSTDEVYGSIGSGSWSESGPCGHRRCAPAANATPPPCVPTPRSFRCSRKS